MSTEDTQDSKATNSLNEAEAKKRQLVNFVANNILNSITLNQTITVVQQIAMRDANTIVSEADEEKLKQIEDAYNAAIEAQQAQAQQAAAEQTAEEPAAKETKKKSRAKSSKAKTTA
jgi:hypothetical protein